MEAATLNLLTIAQWGTGKWASMAGAFYGSSNMTMTATDAPDLSGVTDMVRMFQDASAFNGNIASWNTSNVTNISRCSIGPAPSTRNRPLATPAT